MSDSQALERGHGVGAEDLLGEGGQVVVAQGQGLEPTQVAEGPIADARDAVVAEVPAREKNRERMQESLG